MSMLVQNTQTILKNAPISYESKLYLSQFWILKGNLIKVTRIIQ